eukprot:jgi/Hompol1/3441/HPOL_006533-RA
MGCGSSSLVEDELDDRRNKEIELSIRREQEQRHREAKVLLLGAGESGKSTILRQMSLIHGNGFTPAEREVYKQVIISNAIQSMRVVLQAMRNLEITFSNQRSPLLRATLEDLPLQIDVQQM